MAGDWEIRWQFSRIGFADRFDIQVSSDGITWTTLTTRGNAGTNGTWETLPVDESGRYLRFLFRNPNRDRQLGYLSGVIIS